MGYFALPRGGLSLYNPEWPLPTPDEEDEWTPGEEFDPSTCCPVTYEDCARNCPQDAPCALLDVIQGATLTTDTTGDIDQCPPIVN